MKIQGDPTSPEYGSSAETAWDEITTKVNAVNISGVSRSKDFIRKVLKFCTVITRARKKVILTIVWKVVNFNMLILLS